MILLLGGTSDTAPLAEQLAQAGLRVLVSTATDQELFVGDHPGIRRRHGRLDEQGLAELARRECIRTIVDVTHPYATDVRRNARTAAMRLGIPYLTFVRPPAVDDNGVVRLVSGHPEAAELAFSHRRAVLLTTGANHLADYALQAGRTGLPLYVRILSRRESLAKCRNRGIPEERIITGRGPFSVEENRRDIQRAQAGVLVTKDGGSASGVSAKLEAARLENCCVIAVRRPPVEVENTYSSLDELAHQVIAESQRIG